MGSEGGETNLRRLPRVGDVFGVCDEPQRNDRGLGRNNRIGAGLPEAEEDARVTDSRIDHAKAAINDATTFLRDIQDELPLLDPTFGDLDQAAELLNEALILVMKVTR